MANYIARVELHQAGPEDYERLNATMQQRGYVREMTGEDGADYQLPTGTYFVTNTSAVLRGSGRGEGDRQECRSHCHGLEHGSMGWAFGE
jgi:hypothetical protein